MKKVKCLLLLMLALSSFSSCSKENEDISSEKLYVKVENASEINNVAEVKLMVYDKSIDKDIELARGEWKDGGFTILLPQKLNSNSCYALIMGNSGFSPSMSIGWLSIPVRDMPSTMIVSNNNVKFGNVNFWGVDKEGNLVTHFYPFKIDEDGTTRKAFCTYADSDVTISGYYDRTMDIIAIDEDDEYGSTYEYRLKAYTTYSVKWKKGWNVWCLSSFQSISPGSERIVTEEWSSISMSNLKWYGSED